MPDVLQPKDHSLTIANRRIKIKGTSIVCEAYIWIWRSEELHVLLDEYYCVPSSAMPHLSVCVAWLEAGWSTGWNVSKRLKSTFTTLRGLWEVVPYMNKCSCLLLSKVVEHATRQVGEESKHS